MKMEWKEQKSGQKTEELSEKDIENMGEESFPVGSRKTFLFGKKGNVKADCCYNGGNWGFLKPEHIALQEEEEMVSATNYRSCGTEDVTYEYPTFCGRVPVGIYEIKIVQGTDGKEEAVNGFYVNGWKYAGRWSREAFSVNFTEPSEESRIYTPAGEEKTTTVTVAAPSGELVIELASWMDNEGRSGKTYVKEITVTRKPRILEPSKRPTLRFIGDSTLAKYPPEDGGVWVDIPERTGWGEDFSMGRFMDSSVVLVNKAVAGSSLKSYTGDGYWNDFLLESHPGDTVIIESGINDSAVGRRFSDADIFERLLEERIKGCLNFGLKVIVSSGTSSGKEYTERMKSLADRYQLPYVPLLEQWEEYLLKLGITRADVTVDGTHLSRIGGVAAAQIVANAIAGIEGLSISGHVRPLPLNETCPDILVEDLQVKRQAPGSITLKWKIEEEKLYQPKEFITGFQVYCTDGEAPILCGSRSAYVSAGMEHPCCEVTLEAEETKPHSYYVTCKGLTGEGPASKIVTAKPYVPEEKELLETAIRKYSTALYDPFLYTEASWEKLQEALTIGRKEVLSGTDKQKEALQAIEEAEAKLSRRAEMVEQNDFQKEPLQGIPWQIEGKHQTLVSCQMNEEGNRYLKLYVEAAGPRYAWKHFEKAEKINASQILIAFEWYPGQPDLRNCVELEFMRGEKDRLLSLKTSSNGHIGCVAGNYPEDNRYLIGDGFHPYEGSQAVDLFLDNRAWYQIRILFDFEAGEAVVSATLLPHRKGEEGLFTEAENKGKEPKVCRVKLPEGLGQVTGLNFLMKRGRTDGDAANDMAILWCTCLDNFAYYYK